VGNAIFYGLDRFVETKMVVFFCKNRKIAKKMDLTDLSTSCSTPLRMHYVVSITSVTPSEIYQLFCSKDHSLAVPK
jgi:hypothetical protein